MSQGVVKASVICLWSKLKRCSKVCHVKITYIIAALQQCGLWLILGIEFNEFKGILKYLNFTGFEMVNMVNVKIR